MKTTYLVVGGGIAGVTCVETLAILHPEEPLVIITASSLVKNVSNVSFFAKTIVKFDVNETEASSLKKIHPNLQIVYDSLKYVNTKDKIVITDGNIIIQYSVICICTGGVPRLIAASKTCNRILGIRDTESVQEFQEKLRNGRKMVIVGNGGIASEIVHATRGIEKIWVIRDDYISSTFIDPGAAEFFQNTFKKTKDENLTKPTVLRRHIFTEEDTVVSINKNLKSAALGPDWFRKLEGLKSDDGKQELEIIYKVEVVNVVEVNDKEFPLEISLSNGSIINCDFVVSATGVEPCINFMWDNMPKHGADGGLAVNEFQETSISNVFAAGDVASAAWEHSPHWFQLRLWTQARQMAAMAAKAMHARITNEEGILQDFCFELFTHCTTLFGFRVILLGKYNGQGLDKKYEILVRTTPNIEYIKFVLQNGKLQGAILIGETNLEEMCENLILDQIDLTPFGDDILNPDIDIDDYFD